MNVAIKNTQVGTKQIGIGILRKQKILLKISNSTEG
jgi:hypothetical protein